MVFNELYVYLLVHKKLKIYMKKLFLSVLVIIVLSSCSGNKAFYNIALRSVEFSNDVAESEDATICNVYSSGKSICKFNDDKIDISWELRKTQLDFVMLNKSNVSLKILWNEAIYVDENNESSRVMHVGVKYINRNEMQPSSIIAPHAKVSDIVIPTNNIYYIRSRYGKWGESNLFERNDKSLIDKKVKVMLPIEISGLKYEYYFTFNISDIAKI